MDRDEILIGIATSFIDKNVENAVMFITEMDTNNISIIFSIANDSTFVAEKTMVSEEDIEVSMDLENEVVIVNTISRNGWVDERNNQISKNIVEDRKTNYYTVIRDVDYTYLECESYCSSSLEISCDTGEGCKGQSYYDNKKMGKTKIAVNNEYSITDGYPVNDIIKSFVKTYYGAKKNQD